MIKLCKFCILLSITSSAIGEQQSSTHDTLHFDISERHHTSLNHHHDKIDITIKDEAQINHRHNTRSDKTPVERLDTSVTGNEKTLHGITKHKVKDIYSSPQNQPEKSIDNRNLWKVIKKNQEMSDNSTTPSPLTTP